MNNRRRIVLLLFSLLLLRVVAADAYDLATHGTITNSAITRSLGMRNYLDGLGIKDSDVFDPTSVTPFEELGRFFRNTGTAQHWMMEGAVREDDFRPSIPTCPQPANPPTPISRPLNHFFDVQRGGGPLFPSPTTNFSAPDWALGQGGRAQNQFTILDARQYQLKSLTESAKLNREKNTALMFRALGHVLHLVQDMAQPQHTRNDAHSGCLFGLIGGEHSFYEDYIEHRARGARFRSRDFLIPRPVEFSSLLSQSYPAPQFTSYRDFWTKSGSMGLADFSSRNFFTAGTNLSLLFGNCGGLGQPQCSAGAYNKTDHIFVYRKTDGQTVSGEVTLYNRDAVDFHTGAVIPNIPVSSRSLWDQHLEKQSLLVGSFSLNTINYDAMSSILLPRAVGYSVGLLDYYFRGKLDLNLVQDDIDPTVVRLEGKNDSTEKLDGGTLELYSDDTQGVRTRATPVGSSVVTADPGQPISVSYHLPTNADKFMAVYKGKLGDEAPNGDFPGVVIGKVVNSERVEQIFRDGTRWYLRNSAGVFPTALLRSNVDDLQWGDDPNTLVGRSRMGPGQPNKFYKYRLNRLNGATNIPVVTISDPLPDNPTATSIVDLTQEQVYSFPLGTPSGTIVNFSHTLPYRQYLLWRQLTSVRIWTNVDPDDPSIGNYDVPGPPGVAYGISQLVNESDTKNLNYPVVLDEASHIFGSGGSQYLWDVWSVHLTTDGRPLALVQVQFTTNNLGSATFPSKTFGPSSDGTSPPPVIDLPPVQIPFSLPELGPMWVLIDVSNGQILANSAPSTLTMTHTSGRTSYHPNPNNAATYTVASRIHYDGGPQDGFSGWEIATHSFDSGPDCTPQRLEVMMVLQETSHGPNYVQTLLTQNRSEIAQREFGPAPTNPGGVLNFPISCGDEQNPGEGFRVTVGPGPTFSPNNVGEFGIGVVRTTPLANTEKLVFMMAQAQTSETDSQRAKVIAWVPSQQRIDHERTFTDLGLHVLTSASQDAGLFISFADGFSSSQTRLLGFSDNSLATHPGQQLFNYTVLDPGYFYNTSDFKFYSRDGSLQSRGFPVSLAPAPSGNPTGRYHVLTVGGSGVN